ncbi:MAG: ArsR/SmtB family transcription factor [Bacillota bacterium]
MEIYGESNEPVIKTFNSPVIELVCALHLMTDISNHQYEIKWAEETLSKLTDGDIEALKIVKSFPANGIELLNFVLYSRELDNIEKFIDYIRKTDINDFFFYILNEQIEKPRIIKAFNEKKERYKIQEALKWIIQDDELTMFFDKPQQIKEKTVGVFEALYANGFVEKLEACRNKMKEGIEYIESYLGKDSIELVLEKVSGRPKTFFSGYKEYYIIPSYFVSPKFIRVYSGEKLYVVFDCRVTRDKKEALCDSLSSTLKVIDDKSRMAILKLLIDKKSYGKAISDTVGISTPTVSHHLDVLKQAGLVKEEKIRNIKYFYADRERLKALIEDINKYFFNAE